MSDLTLTDATKSLHDATLDLLWSQWTELGVPGTQRRHQHTAIDPEPLVIVTPWLAANDTRLLGLVAAWCEAHHAHLSTTRLQALLQAAPLEAQRAFSGHAAQVNARAGARWPVVTDAAPFEIAEVRRPPLPVSRPALVHLRARALSGVGLRADTLIALLAASPGWRTATDLAHRGYSKRNVAVTLSDLAASGVTEVLPRGNSLQFRLAHPAELRRVLGAEEVELPDSVARLSLLAEMTDLARTPGNAGLRRVLAHQARERWVPRAFALDLPLPPVTQGEPNAWEAVVAWAAGVVAGW